MISPLFGKSKEFMPRSSRVIGNPGRLIFFRIVGLNRREILTNLLQLWGHEEGGINYYVSTLCRLWVKIRFPVNIGAHPKGKDVAWTEHPRRGAHDVEPV